MYLPLQTVPTVHWSKPMRHCRRRYDCCLAISIPFCNVCQCFPLSVSMMHPYCYVTKEKKRHGDRCNLQYPSLTCTWCWSIGVLYVLLKDILFDSMPRQKWQPPSIENMCPMFLPQKSDRNLVLGLNCLRTHSEISAKWPTSSAIRDFNAISISHVNAKDFQWSSQAVIEHTEAIVGFIYFDYPVCLEWCNSLFKPTIGRKVWFPCFGMVLEEYVVFTTDNCRFCLSK